MVSKRRSNKYINKLEIIFLLFLGLILSSCSSSEGKFNLVLKKSSGSEEKGVLTFKNLSNNNTISKEINVNESLDINLELDSNYEIEYRSDDSKVFAYIKKIRPSDYNSEKVFLALNKNKSFSSIIEMNDTIEDDLRYYYLYANNYLYRTQGGSFKKLSLLQAKALSVSTSFDTSDNKVISLDGNYLINENKIAFIDDDDKLIVKSHEVSSLKFIDERHLKISDRYYFLVNKTDKGTYDCFTLNKSASNITINKVETCVDFSISADADLLARGDVFYIWDFDKMYRYSEGRFTLVTELTGKSGKVFQNMNNFYLISEQKIYLMDLDENSFTLLEGIDDIILNNSIKVFRVNKTTNLISSSEWKDGENYYIFNDNIGKISLEKNSLSKINLKNIENIEIDQKQNIFLNNSSFEISNQKFNGIKFYNFSYFK